MSGGWQPEWLGRPDAGIPELVVSTMGLGDWTWLVILGGKSL